MSDGAAAGRVAARRAATGDLPELGRLYHQLADEMIALRPMWALGDALPEPVGDSLAAMLTASEWTVVVGTIDDVPVGFLAWRDEPLLPQAGGERVAAIRFVFTEAGARGVGVGEAMMIEFYAGAALRGIRRFDAHVSPGHRAAKNFFEANGFKARSIVMHRSDD